VIVATSCVLAANFAVILDVVDGEMLMRVVRDVGDRRGD
jgi:hypothetical protein